MFFTPIAFYKKSTTTAAPTSYQWIFTTGFSTKLSACNAIPGAQFLWSISPSLGVGVPLYTDSATTLLFNGNNLYYQEESTVFSGQISTSGVIQSNWSACLV